MSVIDLQMYQNDSQVVVRRTSLSWILLEENRLHELKKPQTKIGLRLLMSWNSLVAPYRSLKNARLNAQTGVLNC